FRELEITAAASARGVPTPTVIAAAEYADGPLLRFDIVFDFVVNAKDLAALIFDHPESATAAVPAIQSMLRAGLVHADLNLKNILIAGDRALLIDLDKARLEEGPNRSAALTTQARQMRSLRKFEAKTGRREVDKARWAFERA